MRRSPPRPRRSLGSTPLQVFVLIPAAAILSQLLLPGGLQIRPAFLPIMAAGYLLFHHCGSYRMARGGGAAGFSAGVPPQHLVTAGIYAFTRNPMYLGHLLFLAGLALTLRSPVGLLLGIAEAVRLQGHVRRDERRLEGIFGEEYRTYRRRVRRWVPWLF